MCQHDDSSEQQCKQHQQHQEQGDPNNLNAHPEDSLKVGGTYIPKGKIKNLPICWEFRSEDRSTEFSEEIWGIISNFFIFQERALW